VRPAYAGVLLSIGRLVLLVYGIVRGGNIGSWIHPAVPGPIAAGLAILAAFGW
jgi:DHA2 family multidrug resistance protein-like MFS transporter